MRTVIRVTTGLVLALGLAALPAAAQTTAQPPAVTIPADATTTTGTVIEVRDDHVVLETADGVRHDLYWVDGAIGRDLLVADRSVTVTFDAAGDRARLYRIVTPGLVDSESRLEQNVEEFVADVDEEVDSALDSIDEEADETARDVGEAFDAAGDEVDDLDEELAGTGDDPADELGTELPATGSNAPLAALLGLTLLGGAVALRFRS